MIISWKGSDIDISKDMGRNDIINTLKGHMDAKGRPKKTKDLLREYNKTIKAIEADTQLSEDEKEERKELVEKEFVKIIKDFFKEEPLISYINNDGYGWTRFSRMKTGKEGSAENTFNVRYAENLKLKEVKDGDVREKLSGVGALKFAERGTQKLNLPPFDFRTFIRTQKNNDVPIQEDMILREKENIETGSGTGVFSFMPEGDVKQDGKNYHFKMTYGNIKSTDLEELKTNHIREITGQNPIPERSKTQTFKIGSDVFNTEVRFSDKVIKKVTEQAAERPIEWYEYKKTRIPNPTYREGSSEPKTMVNYEIVREGTLGFREKAKGQPTHEQYNATIESKAEYFELEVDGKKGLYGFKAPSSSQYRLKQAFVEFTNDTDIPKLIEENNAQIQEIFRPYLESATDIMVPIICGKFSKSERAEATFDQFKESLVQDDAELEGFTIGSRDNLDDKGKVKLTNLNEIDAKARKEKLDELGKKAFVLKENLKTKDKKKLSWKYTGKSVKIGDIQLVKDETIDNATYEKVLQNIQDMEEKADEVMRLLDIEELEEFKELFNRTRKTAEQFISFDEYAKLSLDDKEKYAPNLTMQTGAGIENVKSSVNFVGKKTYAIGDLKLSEMITGEGFLSKKIPFLLALDFYVRQEGKFNLKPAGRESANRPMASRVNDLKTKIRTIERKFGDVTEEVES
jgi:hypothetical protein